MELYEVTVEYVKYLRKFEPTKIMSISQRTKRERWMKKKKKGN